MSEIKSYNKIMCTPLEQFMIEVAMLLGCLPSFADPGLEGGNTHIKRRIEQLLKTEEKYNQSLQPIADRSG